jgi:hypothetical protein
MTPKPKIEIKQPASKPSSEDKKWNNWVEEEGRKLKPGEIDEILRNAPVSDGHSRPLEEVMAELDLEFEDDDED